MTLQPTIQPDPGQHPLEQLSAEEIVVSRKLLAAFGLVSDHTRFAYLGLVEPPKNELYGGSDGSAPNRVVRAMLWNPGAAASLDVQLSLTEQKLISQRELDPAVDGQLPVMVEEFDLIETVLQADRNGLPPWHPGGSNPTKSGLRPCLPGLRVSR